MCHVCCPKIWTCTKKQWLALLHRHLTDHNLYSPTTAWRNKSTWGLQRHRNHDWQVGRDSGHAAGTTAGTRPTRRCPVLYWSSPPPWVCAWVDVPYGSHQGHTNREGWQCYANNSFHHNSHDDDRHLRRNGARLVGGAARTWAGGWVGSWQHWGTGCS